MSEHSMSIEKTNCTRGSRVAEARNATLTGMERVEGGRVKRRARSCRWLGFRVALDGTAIHVI
jgi:hypothetical protein